MVGWDGVEWGGGLGQFLVSALVICASFVSLWSLQELRCLWPYKKSRYSSLDKLFLVELSNSIVDIYDCVLV